MHILAPTISIIDAGKVLVSWTGSEALNAWIEVNGVFVYQDLVFSSETRRKIVRMDDTTKPFALAIQEAEAGSDLSPICEMPTTEPDICFDAVATAKQYQIYHRGPDDTAESANRTIPAEERRRHYSVGLYDQLDHGWHYFRVESLDQYGRESTRAAWLYYAVDLPPYPELASVAKSGSEYILTIGESETVDYLLVQTTDGLAAYADGLRVICAA